MLRKDYSAERIKALVDKVREESGERLANLYESKINEIPQDANFAPIQILHDLKRTDPEYQDLEKRGLAGKGLLKRMYETRFTT